MRTEKEIKDELKRYRKLARLYKVFEAGGKEAVVAGFEIWQTDIYSEGRGYHQTKKTLEWVLEVKPSSKNQGGSE